MSYLKGSVNPDQFPNLQNMLYFDGNRYVVFENEHQLHLDEMVLLPFSISLKFLTSVTGLRTLLMLGIRDNANFTVGIEIYQINFVVFFKISTNNGESIIISQAITLDRLNECVFTYDGSGLVSGMNIYIKGVDVNNVVVTSETLVQYSYVGGIPNQAYIGVEVEPSGSTLNIFLGYLSNILMFGKELTENDRDAIFQSKGLCPYSLEQNVIADYDFNYQNLYNQDQNILT